jgi:MSHA biogenesis protein MshQ
MNAHPRRSIRRYRWALLLPVLLLADMAFADTFTFRDNNALPSGGGKSICSGSWSRSGSVFTCSGTLTLDAGDILEVRTGGGESLTDITIVANSISLSSNTIGTAAKNISLQTSFGNITATGTNSIAGSVTTASGAINLSGTSVSGSVTGSGTATLSGGSIAGNLSIAGNITSNGTTIGGNVASNFGVISLTAGSVGGAVSSGGSINTNGTLVNGSLTSNSGTVNLSGGSIGGVVRSGCCNVTTNGTDLLAGARSDSSGLSITGGTIAGSFVAANNPAIFSGVTMTSGSVSGASTVTFSNSAVGSAQNSVTVTSVSGPVTLNNSTVYGNLTAPSYSTIFVNSPSTVIGTCVPNSTPANACSPANGAVTEILSWSLDEAAWSGAANEVVDASGNGLNGSVFNGANTADGAPALPAQNSLGTCAYGSFNSAANQYVQRAHNDLLTLQDRFTIGLWVKPNTLPASGLMSILSKDENYEFHLKPNGTVNWWWQTTANATRQFDSSVALTPGQWSHVLIRFAPGDQRIYINGNLAGQASFSGTPRANSDPLQLGQDQGLAGRYFNGQLDELRIYSGALSEAAISALVAERHQCELALQCFNDDFGRASLGGDWSVASRGATAFTPTIASARMRLTSNQSNVATSSTLQRLFPAAGNYIQVQFKHYAYNGSGADGIAVVLSDASVTPQPGAFGGPLGYGTRGDAANPGFAGGWLGVGIDEYGNFSTEGGSPDDGPGQRNDSVAIRGSGSGSEGYRYIAGTPANLNPAIDAAASTSAGPGHTYRITVDGRVDGQALVTVERDSGAGFEVLPNLDAVDVLTAFGQAALPDNLYLSLTGSTGGSTNIHELDDLQVCATAINPIDQQVHHFELVYSNPALTCNPQPITVRACRNADCSLLYTDPVNVTLAPSSGWNATGGGAITSGNNLEFEGGVANLKLGHSVAEVVTVGASLPPPMQSNSQTVCSTIDCQITYADSGFLIDVPNTLAAKLTPASITAVRKSDDAPVCVPTFQGVERTISFTSVYTNPATGTRDVLVSAGDSAETDTPASIALSFDATGRAPFFVRYEDAGLITLSASYIGSEGTGDAGVVLVGSDTFVSKPYGLLLQTNTSSSCTDPDLTCPLFPGGVRAGDPFDLRISAVAWQSDGEALTATDLADNLITPNFQMDDIGLSSLVVGPSNGVNGEVTPGNYDHLQIETTTVPTAISEVGVFNLIATPTADYLEEGEVVSGGTSGLVGRFIPAYLNASGNASLTGSCGTFSYQGQPMDFAPTREPLLTVSGYNRLGAVTQNYDRGDFWRLVAPAVGSYSSTTGLTVDAHLVTQGTAGLSVEGADNGDGTRSYRWSGEQLLYTPAALPSADDVPFMAAISQSFSAASLTDADGACYGAGVACEDFSYAFTNDPGSEVRLGRLRIGNAHGSELQALNLPLTVESWQATATGNSFAPEGLDNCTAAVLGAPVLDPFTGSLAAGETTPSLSGPTAGSGLVGLTAPGAGNEGSVRVSFLPALPPTWLYYDWSGSGREMASGLATFGIYRGAAPLIFRRELYR